MFTESFTNELTLYDSRPDAYFDNKIEHLGECTQFVGICFVRLDGLPI